MTSHNRERTTSTVPLWFMGNKSTLWGKITVCMIIITQLRHLVFWQRLYSFCSIRLHSNWHKVGFSYFIIIIIRIKIYLHVNVACAQRGLGSHKLYQCTANGQRPCGAEVKHEAGTVLLMGWKSGLKIRMISLWHLLEPLLLKQNVLNAGSS